MLRKLAAVSLLVSFVALASSGIVMLFVARPSFTIQMHPVHKLFGLVMVAAAAAHLSLNARALQAHLKPRVVAVTGTVLVVALVVLYAVAVARPLPGALAKQMDDAAMRAEAER